MAERGYGMFIHFGMNTFINKEWSEGIEPASTYNPTALDCDQWVRVARDAGFRYVLLVAKHHDGFCLWNSSLTDYDIASSPVPVDILAEVSEACRKYGLGFALYYSLWDLHEPAYTSSDFNSYINYMEGQLTEILSGYGDICELWLDGAWDKPDEMWQMPRIYSLVKKLQPMCAVGVNGTISDKPDNNIGYTDVLPDKMTEDNRYYIRYFPGDFRLWDPKIAAKNDVKQYLHNGQSYYLPFEHTICLSKQWNWFQKDRLIETRDLDELQELFYWATDNNNSLVVNLSPDRTGRIREHEANTVIELRRRLGIEPGRPLPRNGECISVSAPAEASSTWGDSDEFAAGKAVDGGMQTRWASATPTATLEIELDPEKTFNKISIFEYCDEIMLDNISRKRSNRITSYSVDRLMPDGAWQTIYYSTEPMGDCKIISFPVDYSTSRLRLNILSATDLPSIYEFNVINNPR